MMEHATLQLLEIHRFPQPMNVEGKRARCLLLLPDPHGGVGFFMMCEAKNGSCNH